MTNMNSNSFYCRLCAELHPEYDLIEINDEKSINLNLAYKIAHCYNVNITVDDLLPKHVCSDCCDKVTSAFEFHEQVQRAQETLIKRVINVKQENNTNFLTSHIKVDNDDHFMDDDNFDDFDTTDIKPGAYTKDDSSQFSSDDEKPLAKRKYPSKSLHSSDNSINNDTDVKPTKLETKKHKKHKWKCAECDEILTTEKKYRVHYLTIHNKPPEYRCSYSECSKVYNSYESYASHRRVHKGNNICDICARNCRDAACLRQHMQIHSHLTPFPCVECNKAFKTLRLLQSHQNSHLPDEIKKKFECDICEKKFTSKAPLNVHRESHLSNGEPKKNFVCEQCGRNFRQKANLNQHMSTHLDVFPFRCDRCPKAFKNIYSLRRHQKNHLDGQLYKCDVCLRMFKHKRALKRHSNIHTNKLPYECEHCKKCFREKSYLKIHLRQHTGERPYSCIECNHHFTNDSNFIKHLKGRHGLDKFSVANQRQYPFIN